MRSRVMALGDRSLCGNYSSVKAAGNLEITDSTIKKLSCAGDVTITKSKIGKFRCAGNIEGDASYFADLKHAGSINLKGVCQGGTITIKGVALVDLLDCKILRNGFIGNRVKVMSSDEGVSWNGSFKADTFENTSFINLDFEYDFKSIINVSVLHSKKEIICENFYNFNELNVPEINGENIFILTRDEIKINQLVGSNVIIQSQFTPDKLYRNIPKSISNKKIAGEKNIVKVKNIEADKIHIEYTKSDLVSGQDVIIGDLCIIDRVEYSNRLRISDKAVVNEVIKL
ncbi:MAG: hypothetical protein GX915_03750 [Clostridiales bacterium]|nr:hypothetical protein [Clostridiales bacterium]